MEMLLQLVRPKDTAQLTAHADNEKVEVVVVVLISPQYQRAVKTSHFITTFIMHNYFFSSHLAHLTTKMYIMLLSPSKCELPGM